jgi:hypothetical protein
MQDLYKTLDIQERGERKSKDLLALVREMRWR